MAQLLMAEGSFNAPSKILVLSPNSVLCCRYSLRSYSNLGIQIKVQAADKIPLFNANTLRIFKFGCTRIIGPGHPSIWSVLCDVHPNYISVRRQWPDLKR